MTKSNNDLKIIVASTILIITATLVSIAVIAKLTPSSIFDNHDVSNWVTLSVEICIGLMIGIFFFVLSNKQQRDSNEILSNFEHFRRNQKKQINFAISNVLDLIKQENAELQKGIPGNENLGTFFDNYLGLYVKYIDKLNITSVADYIDEKIIEDISALREKLSAEKIPKQIRPVYVSEFIKTIDMEIERISQHLKSDNDSNKH